MGLLQSYIEFELDLEPWGQKSILGGVHLCATNNQLLVIYKIGVEDESETHVPKIRGTLMLHHDHYIINNSVTKVNLYSFFGLLKVSRRGLKLQVSYL